MVLRMSLNHGLSDTKIAQYTGIHPRTMRGLCKQLQDTVEIVEKPVVAGWPRLLNSLDATVHLFQYTSHPSHTLLQFLKDLVEHPPDITLCEIADYLGEICHIDASQATIARTLYHCRFTQKKVLFDFPYACLASIFHRLCIQLLNKMNGIVLNLRCSLESTFSLTTLFLLMKATSIDFPYGEIMLGPLEATVLGGATFLYVVNGMSSCFRSTWANFDLATQSSLRFCLTESCTLKSSIILSLGMILPILFVVFLIRCNHGLYQTQCS